MASRFEGVRFWLPVAAMAAFGIYVGQKLVSSHVRPSVNSISYGFSSELAARRGTICCKGGRPVAESTPLWRYSLDPRSMGSKSMPREVVMENIASTLSIPKEKVAVMAARTSGPGWRHQFLAESDDQAVFAAMTDRRRILGVAVDDLQRRRYLCGRSLSHVLGSVNAEGVGSCGIEQRFNSRLAGTPGKIEGIKDAYGNEIRDRRVTSVPPTPGDTVTLTVDVNLQYAAEKALKWGMAEFGAESGWCIVMDVGTAAVLALASMPDFDPVQYGRATDAMKIDRAIAYNFEPGSVMKTITAAAAIDCGRVTPETMYSTDRNDDRYYRLPHDSHAMPPRMSVKEAIVHSSNTVMGKIGYDLGPERMYDALKRFGFGAKTGIELPGEECGILWHWKKWDKASWSRVPIGQAVSVTAIQLVGAYQAIANDGVRMHPHIVEKAEDADGRTTYMPQDAAAVAVKPETARKVRQMMVGVSEMGGTARRARVKGYSVAGKTGTAQKAKDGVYLQGLYCASYCGIIPSGVVQFDMDGKRHFTDPSVVILVSLDFDHFATFHQGGNSSAVVFRKLAQYAMRYLGVTPDRPDELSPEASAEDEVELLPLL